jgi:hypothetical protein
MDLYKGMDQLRGLSELYRQMNNPPAPEGEDVQERADTWHPDPEKDRKLGGPGANQRAREDRADAAKAAAKKNDDNKLRPGESYMDYAKRKKAERTRKEEVDASGNVIGGVEVEEGYKEIDKKRESQMYRRAGNLARKSLVSRNRREKEEAQNKSAKIVSAISRQKENERFSKMGDEKARSNYGESYEKAIKANQKELDKLEKGQEPATAKRYREMKKKVDEATYPSDFINPDGSKRSVAKKKYGRGSGPKQHDQETDRYGRRKTVDESDNFTLIADFLISEGQVKDHQDAIEFLTGAPEEFIESVLKFAEERQLFMNYVVETGHCADLDEAAIVYAESDEELVRDVIDSITE